MFEGIYTALVTPFSADGAVDFGALKTLVAHQLKGGIHGLVPCGTTGEGVTLTEEERLAVIQAVISQVDGHCPVIAGIGTNDTAQTVRLARAVESMGADGALVVAPYYNKPTQEGLYQHVRAVCNAAPDLPVMVYNIPSRCSVGFTVDTLLRLAELPGVVAVKEATSDLAFGGQLAAAAGERLTVTSGDDATALPLWAVGGQGVVSVASNALPAPMVALWDAFKAGQLDEALRIHQSLLPLFSALFLETNPAPVKAALSWLLPGFSPTVRLPLVEPGAATLDKLHQALARLEVLA